MPFLTRARYRLVIFCWDGRYVSWLCFGHLDDSKHLNRYGQRKLFRNLYKGIKLQADLNLRVFINLETTIS